MEQTIVVRSLTALPVAFHGKKGKPKVVQLSLDSMRARVSQLRNSKWSSASFLADYLEHQMVKNRFVMRPVDPSKLPAWRPKVKVSMAVCPPPASKGKLV